MTEIEDPATEDSKKRAGLTPDLGDLTETKKAKLDEPLSPEPQGESVVITPAPKSVLDYKKHAEVQLSQVDKAPSVTISNDNLVASSTKGYRSVRATHGARCGTWYFEVHVKHLGSSGHCRLGWAAKKAELQAPVGYDAHGYSYRDIGGTKVHMARREQYGDPYSEGDVVGCLLHLPGKGSSEQKHEIFNYRGIPVEVVGEEQAKVVPGSCIAFAKNGALQGVAFRDLPEDTYYPAGSLYTLPNQAEGASIEFNFGPEFKFQPPELEGLPSALPVCRLAEPADAAAEPAGGDEQQPQQPPPQQQA
mmetsp:Transcript_5464/g.13338  ORF Transcript_5464/g.13338 Transcript_5464/m.13338 type:complete len:305 (+) Transcript_5464:298-1212(+)